mmetsp:Transcript_98983/g.283179  ORF Transcript_98983/g.283179 Transcript_98983/m.283179 type:complete len:108 (+) Transcript_98983:388-711(+)
MATIEEGCGGEEGEDGGEGVGAALATREQVALAREQAEESPLKGHVSDALNIAGQLGNVLGYGKGGDRQARDLMSMFMLLSVSKDEQGAQATAATEATAAEDMFRLS